MTAQAQRKAKEAENEVKHVNEEITEQEQILEAKNIELHASVGQIHAKDEDKTKAEEELKVKEEDL